MSKETNRGKLSYVVNRIKERDDQWSYEWRKAFREIIEELFANYSLLFGETTRNGEKVSIYMDFSPMSNIFDYDQRLFSDLSSREKNYIKHLFFQKLQFDPHNKKPAGESYLVSNGKGTEVTPYYTGISETTGLYLHELIEKNIVVDYVVAPLEYTL